ncbi:DMT family transporter [Candidatus Woesebacteria bacterium]|nr:DMT family transporter [Candidatus Woesebacteria bacterium]
MKKGYLYVLIAVSLWAVSSGILVKFITIPAFALYSIGAFWGALFLVLSLFKKRKLGDLLKYDRRTLKLMLGLGLGIAANNGLFFAGVKSGSVANATLTHYLSPLLVVLLFAPLMNKEKISSRNVLLSLLGLCGLLILVLPSLGRAFDLAIIFGSLSAFFSAFHTVLEKKVTQTKADPLTAVVYKNAVPMIVFAPFAIGAMQSGISPGNWLWLVIWGVAVLGISFIFYFKGIKEISATEASILSYGEAIGAIILAAIFFGEPIAINTIMGGLLIIASGIGVVKYSAS